MKKWLVISELEVGKFYLRYCENLSTLVITTHSLAEDNDKNLRYSYIDKGYSEISYKNVAFPPGSKFLDITDSFQEIIDTFLQEIKN